MPFYEYECQACRFYTEIMQKISDAPLTRCPSCGKQKLKKLVSAPVFRLKGAGWYETDFKSDKEPKRNLLGADREERKAEAKPAAPAPVAKETKDAGPAPAKPAQGSAVTETSTARKAAKSVRRRSPRARHR
ncbi:MAG TPA: zinc ribbon domain-containing protein [Steroidobacteraceae bacterium]|nr:zinc ribbon domain-containing protein [Steroidobacteraceae bacterium]